MGYFSSLEAAGAKVLGYQTTGSYQGTWGAVVIYDGKLGLVTGAYGSCSMCDSFESEFGYDNDCKVYYHEENDKYYANDYDYSEDNEITKESYDNQKAEYQNRLADFGRRYLHQIWDKFDIDNRLKNFNPDEWYDEEEKELLEWSLSFFSIN